MSPSDGSPTRTYGFTPGSWSRKHRLNRYKVRYTILATKLCSDVNLFVAKFEQVVLNQFRSEINHDELMSAHALNFRMDVLAQHRCEHEIRDGQGIPCPSRISCSQRCCARTSVRT